MQRPAPLAAAGRAPTPSSHGTVPTTEGVPRSTSSRRLSEGALGAVQRARRRHALLGPSVPRPSAGFLPATAGLRLLLSREAVAQSPRTGSNPRDDLVWRILTATDGGLKQMTRRETGLDAARGV